MTNKMTSSSTAQGGGTRPRIQRPCMLHSIKAPMTTPPPPNECNYSRAKEISTWNELLNERRKTMFPPKAPPSTPTNLSPTDEKSSLFLFDPVHTLQFLLYELEFKLTTSHSDDKAVPKILLEIHQAMKRVASRMSVKGPPMVTAPRTSCTLQENVENQENRVKRLNSSCQTNEYNSATLREEKAAQTETDPCKDFTGFTGFDRFSMETQIKQSHEKLKGNCDALEKACAALQDEKSHTHKELRKCRDEIAALKTEISYLQARLKETRTANKCTADQLDEQRKRLQDQVRILQDFLSKQTDQRLEVESLSGKLKESSEKVLLLEKSRMEMDKTLVFTKLEKEKLMILHKYQAEQIQNLQVDLNAFHILIKEQLNVIQNSVRHRNPRNFLPRIHRKISDRTKIILSTQQGRTCAQNPVRVSKNLESNQPQPNNSDANGPKRIKNPAQRKGKLMISVQQGASSAAAVSGANDESFETKSIILNDRFPEHDSTIGTELSSPPPPPPSSSSIPKPLVRPPSPPSPTTTTTPLGPPTGSGGEGAHRSHRGLPATSAHRKKHFSNEGRLQNQHPQIGAGDVRFDEVQASAVTHHHHHHYQRHQQQQQPPAKTKKRATIKKIRSDFDEFRKLLDDVIPTSPTKDFGEFSFSNSPDMSLNFSQLNNSNEQS